MFELESNYATDHADRVKTNPTNGRDLCRTLAHIKNMQGFGYKKWLNITEQLVKMS
jgi:hypothetical protein